MVAVVSGVVSGCVAVYSDVDGSSELYTLPRCATSPPRARVRLLDRGAARPEDRCAARLSAKQRQTARAPFRLREQGQCTEGMALLDPGSSQQPQPRPAADDASPAAPSKRKFDPNSFEYALLSGFAGGVAGTLSLSLQCRPAIAALVIGPDR